MALKSPEISCARSLLLQDTAILKSHHVTSGKIQRWVKVNRYWIPEICHFPKEIFWLNSAPWPWHYESIEWCPLHGDVQHFQNNYFQKKKLPPSPPPTFCYSRHTKTPKPRLPSRKDMAHKTAVVPHAWTNISNSWKLDLSFDCFKTTITSESKAFSSKRSNGPWKQNSCEFCLHIKVGNCYKITPHSSQVVTYKMQNLVASLLPQKKHFLLF